MLYMRVHIYAFKVANNHAKENRKQMNRVIIVRVILLTLHKDKSMR